MQREESRGGHVRIGRREEMRNEVDETLQSRPPSRLGLNRPVIRVCADVNEYPLTFSSCEARRITAPRKSSREALSPSATGGVKASIN